MMDNQEILKLEQELKKSHEILHKLTSNVPGALYQFRLYPDGEMTFPYASNGMDDIYEIPSDDLINDSSIAFNRIHEDDLAMIVASIEDSAKTMKDWDIEYRVNLPKKGLCWIEGHSKPEKLEDGSILWHGYLTDITERKSTDEKLLNQYNLMQNIINTVPARIFWKDKEGTYLGANKLFLQDAGLESVDEVIGKNDFQMPWGKTEGQLYRDDDLSVMNSGNAKIHFEETQTDDNDNIIALLTSKVPLEDEHGKTIGLLGTYTDISEQRNTEKELIELNKSLDERVKKAVQENKESESRLRIAMDGANDGLWEWNIQTNEVYYSPRWFTMLGYEPFELPSTFETLTNLLYPGDKEKLLKNAEEYIAGTSTYYKFELTLKHKDGHWVNILSRAKFATNLDGSFIEPKRLIGTHVDITESKKMQVEIEKTKAITQNQLNLIETIIDSVPIRIFWKDKDGVYLGANQLFIDDAELNTSADIIGKTDFEQTWRESAQQFIEDDAGVVNSGVARLNYEEVQPKEDGSFIYLRTSKVPLVDVNNNTIGILGIYDDITESKKMEIDLQEAKDIAVKANKEFTRHLELFSNNVIASSSDLKGNITYASKALSEISGYSNKELMGQPHSILKSNSTSMKVFKDLWNTIVSGKVWIGELKNTTKNGSFYWVKATISPDYDDKGNIIGYSSVRQDITAEKAKEMFLANMSHEIRTPMNSIIGFIELIKNDSKEETISKYANIAYISSQGLLKIIEDILDISKIESGKIDIEIITFDTSDEIESMKGLFDDKASEKNITLNITTNKAFPRYLKTDPYRIRQIVSNLLSNAIKFTQSGKNIDMNVSYKDKVLCISVKDEGKGIAVDKIDHIFEAFNQEDVSTTREYGGTGLGLSISYELVRLLGGKLQVKSELGVGSEFFFCIPAEEGEAIAKATTPQVLSNRSENIKVLLVEDNKANQLFMKVILKKLNIEFEIAENGLEAFEKFKTNKYDLLLMDENMPIMGGIESTKNILEYEKENDLVHTPIVALTANAIKGDREKFLAAGMDEYLTKPVSKDTLEKVLSIF